MTYKTLILFLMLSLVFSCNESSNDPRFEGQEPGDCTDRADNDTDGDFDCDDSGCKNSPDCKGTQTETKRTISSAPTLPRQTNNIGMTMIKLPAGRFIMGAKWCQDRNDKNKCPDGEYMYTNDMLGVVQAHEVTLDSFWISETEVTQSQFQLVMGFNPSHHTRDVVGRDSSNHPVETVGWTMALKFANKLSRMENLTECYQNIKDYFSPVTWIPSCNGYRLLTEAEWEYAARANSNYLFPGSERLDDVAWFAGNAQGQTQTVKSKLPNTWGLYDMAGNVSEMVWNVPWEPGVEPVRNPRGNPNPPPVVLNRLHRSCGFGDPLENTCSVLFRDIAQIYRGGRASLGIRIGRSAY